MTGVGRAPVGRTLGWMETLDFCHCMKYHMACPGTYFSWSLDFSVTVKVRVFVRPQGLWGASASLYLVPRSTTQWVQIGPWLSW